eukprot:10892539-Lingulodinium_polyedra.AAC.1
MAAYVAIARARTQTHARTPQAASRARAQSQKERKKQTNNHIHAHTHTHARVRAHTHLHRSRTPLARARSHTGTMHSVGSVGWRGCYLLLATGLFVCFFSKGTTAESCKPSLRRLLPDGAAGSMGNAAGSMLGTNNEHRIAVLELEFPRQHITQTHWRA